MSYLSRLLKQTATYWAPASSSTYDQYGDLSFAAPVTLSCRWEDRADIIPAPKGDEKELRAFVWTTTSIAVDGYLFLGTSSTTNPESVSGADRIRRIEKVPNTKNKQSLFKAFL